MTPDEDAVSYIIPEVEGDPTKTQELRDAFITANDATLRGLTEAKNITFDDGIRSDMQLVVAPVTLMVINSNSD